MASLVKDLIEAGIHYGHRSSAWNPKMQAYIYAKKNGIHIVDVRETVKGLLLAKKFITKTVASGKDVLFVGTKRQARPAVKQVEAEHMPYVIERWLGGTLTNFRTIRSRLKRLEELESLMGGSEWENYSKKMASQLTRERKKIDRNLGGIRTMDRLPGAVVVVDVTREVNALREAAKLGIPTVCLIDTDSDPDLADLPIPGNDDAMRAIDLVIKQLLEAVKEGKSARAQKSEGKDQVSPTAPTPRRRSSRAKFRADEESDEAGDESAEAAPQPEATEPAAPPAPAVEAPAPDAPPAEPADLPKPGEIFEQLNVEKDRKEQSEKPADG